MPVRPFDLLTVQPLLCVLPYVQGQELQWKEGVGERREKGIRKKAGGGSSNSSSSRNKKKHSGSRNADKMRQIWEAAGSEIGGVREHTVLREA